MLSDPSVISINPRVISAQDRDVLALCALDTATVYRLSSAGTAVWQRLSRGPVTLVELRLAVGAMVDAPAPDTIRFVDGFIDELEKHGLVLVMTV